MACRRYDVYFEDSHDDELILMKFPSMKSQLDGNPNSIHLSMKPQTRTMNLQVDINERSLKFDRHKAEMLANKSVPNTFRHNLVDKNIYTSTCVKSDNKQLCVARLVNDRLVCRPISEMMIMRSDLRHFDVKEESDVKEDIKPVSVKFAGPERPNQSSRQGNVKEEPDAEIPDVEKDLVYRSPNSAEAASMRSILFGMVLPKVKPDPDAEPLDIKPTFYHPDIKPKIERMDDEDIYQAGQSNDQDEQAEQPMNVDNTGEDTKPKNQSNTRFDKVKRLVKECLVRAKIASFEEIHEYIRGSQEFADKVPTNADIVRALTDTAVLVQGNWAIKSNILYEDPKEIRTTMKVELENKNQEKSWVKYKGVPKELFEAARDYLLWLYTRDRIINRAEFTKRVRMGDDFVKSLFEDLSIYDESKASWELKLKTDLRFMNQFPEVVQRQSVLWDVRRANKLAMFK